MGTIYKADSSCYLGEPKNVINISSYVEYDPKSSILEFRHVVKFKELFQMSHLPISLFLVNVKLTHNQDLPIKFIADTLFF